MKTACSALILICVAFGGAACSSDECKTILQARILDKANMCVGPSVEVGCTTAKNCDASVAWAIDSNGRCFFFTSLCVPEGFTILRSDDIRCPTSTTVSLCSN